MASVKAHNQCPRCGAAKFPEDAYCGIPECADGTLVAPPTHSVDARVAVTPCENCHHRPSHGNQCYCICHDKADAAPDLYEALDALLSVIRVRNLATPLDKNGVVGVDALTYADTVLSVARAALAKADGR